MNYLIKLIYIINKGKFIIAGIFIFIFLIIFIISNKKDFIVEKNNYSQQQSIESNCMANRKILEASIEMYIMDQNINEEKFNIIRKVSEMSFLKDYLYKGEIPKCLSGGEYIIENKKIKCTIHGY
ncbi:MAG: hypothetical protein M0R46_08870 [Candidatus Muirbacterium halophilum]|nr:hypothetical protein [Candidatus Muirbacterium halophilum]MCK9476017.1 hypothetical protein [Candidatus Muirbacterium halophilum]